MSKKYGQLPKQLGIFEVECKEMMFYQYLPIKIKGDLMKIWEPRLDIFDCIITAVVSDFATTFGFDEYLNSYIYLTAKYLYQVPNCSFNRMGWHSDGFMTDDINYIWCDKYPTIFNTSSFKLSQDDRTSLMQMDCQAFYKNNVTFRENELLRLNQFNIHKVANVNEGGMRAFLKVSFSKDKYDLIGNSHNYLLDYDWQMKERKQERNIPQSTIKTEQ